MNKMEKKINSTGSEMVTLPLREYSELLDFKINIEKNNVYKIQTNQWYSSRFISVDEAVKELSEKILELNLVHETEISKIETKIEDLKNVYNLSLWKFYKLKKKKR